MFPLQLLGLSKICGFSCEIFRVFLQKKINCKYFLNGIIVKTETKCKDLNGIIVKTETNRTDLNDVIVKTETALMYDAVHLFAKALDELDKSQVHWFIDRLNNLID